MPRSASSLLGLADATQSTRATPDDLVRYIDEMTGALLALAMQTRLEPTANHLAMAKKETEASSTTPSRRSRH